MYKQDNGGIESLLDQRKELLEELINSDIIDEEHGYYDDVKGAIESNDSEQMREIIDELLSSGLIYKDDWDYKLARKLSKESKKMVKGGGVRNYKEKNETMDKMNKYRTGGEVYSDSKWLTKNQWEKWNKYVKTGKIDDKKENNIFAVARWIGVPVESINAYEIEKRDKKNKFAVGGEVGNQVSFKGDYGTPRSGIVKEKRGSSYIVATDNGDRLVDSYEVISFSDAPMEKKKRFGFFEGGGEILGKIYEREADNLPIAIEYKQREIRKSYPEQATYIEYGSDSKGEYAVVKAKGKAKFEGGGEIQSKIDKLKKVVSSKMLPESVKDKARKQIAELEKELHESKETKNEYVVYEDSSYEIISKHSTLANAEKSAKELANKNKNKIYGFGSIEKYERFKAEDKAEVKKPTTKKAPAKKATDKSKVVGDDLKVIKFFDLTESDWNKMALNERNKLSDSYKEKNKPAKADHKKLLAKIKAKKGAAPSNEPSKGHKRSESSDRKREALPLGKRVSADGNTYYENRLNRADMNKEDKFKEGGEIGENNSGWGLKFLKW
jgi:hypothetical protein